MALILNGRFFNLEYGSYAPGAPNVFIDDAQFKQLWVQPERYYVVALDSAIPGLESLVGNDRFTVLATSGGKSILTNHPLDGSVSSGHAGEMSGRGTVTPSSSKEMAFWPTSRFAACFSASLAVKKERFAASNQLEGQFAADF
jgi:hypothetical protein